MVWSSFGLKLANKCRGDIRMRDGKIATFWSIKLWLEIYGGQFGIFQCKRVRKIANVWSSYGLQLDDRWLGGEISG